MLKLKKITVSFGAQKILKDLSLEVAPGDLVCIKGHNGAGKSTLFGVIAGSIVPDCGKVLINDDDVTQIPESQRALFVGRLMQDVSAGSVASMTVAENLALATLKGRRAGLRPAKDSFPAWVVDEILHPLNLNLENSLHVPLEQLSGGQRQIIAFVMAILVRPKVLLLDEPTAALDPVSTRKLLGFAKEYVLKHQIPTLLITHDVEVANEFGDWQLELKRADT